MISVGLVDDDHLVRSGIRLILESADDMIVTGEASNGTEAIGMAKRERPDVILMDVRMPGMDGIEATREIIASHRDSRIVILTTFEHDNYVFDALRAGASGFLLKRTPPEQLIEAVRVVNSGEGLLSPSVTTSLIEAFVSGPGKVEPPPELARLTAREHEVLIALATGRSNAELAEDLFISEETVRTHVKRILSKLGLRDRAHAIVFAYESGLVTPG
ncbi:MAG: response regulator [Acidimicrobiia bacterium]|nr:response regulator [Acidimicrobiia bacterium]